MLDQELLSLKEFFFFRQSFELPEQAKLSKLGFKPFSNGLFQRKRKQGVDGGLNHPTPPRPGFFFFFHSQTLHKTLLSHPLKILRPKSKTPGNSTFLITSGNSTLFLIKPRKFLLQFLQYPWEFHMFNLLFVFFWNSPMKECLNSPLSI